MFHNKQYIQFFQDIQFFQEDALLPNPDEDGKTWVHQFVEANNMARLQYNAAFLPAAVNVVTQQGYTPLMLAEKKEVVKFLILKGADAMLIVRRKHYENCAIMEYCEHNHISALTGLLEAFNSKPASEKSALVNSVPPVSMYREVA